MPRSHLSSCFPPSLPFFSPTQHNKPLYSFEDNADYVYDATWSPVHPALFACVDGMGRLDLWNLNNDTEVRHVDVGGWRPGTPPAMELPRPRRGWLMTWKWTTGVLPIPHPCMSFSGPAFLSLLCSRAIYGFPPGTISGPPHPSLTALLPLFMQVNRVCGCGGGYGLDVEILQ